MMPLWLAASAPANPASAPAGLGHNRPPLEEQIPAEFREELLRDRPDFLLKLDELVSAADRAKATNDDELKRCGNLVKAYRALVSHIDETHKTVKEPHLLAGRLCDAEKNALKSQVDEAKRTVVPTEDGSGRVEEALGVENL